MIFVRRTSSHTSPDFFFFFDWSRAFDSFVDDDDDVTFDVYERI